MIDQQLLTQPIRPPHHGAKFALRQTVLTYLSRRRRADVEFEAVPEGVRLRIGEQERLLEIDPSMKLETLMATLRSWGAT
jgi:hypothetical protein